MKRPMCVIGASLAAAALAAFFFSAEQALLLSLAALASGALVFVIYRKRPDIRQLRAVCAVCVSAAIAFALHGAREEQKIAPFLAADGERVCVEGFVSEARMGARTIYYTLAATFPERPDLPDATLTLRAYGEMEYLAGDVIRCEVLLRPKAQPESGLRNTPADFLEGYLQGEIQLAAGGYPVRRALVALREHLRGNVYGLLHSATADIVAAMVLGINDNISPEAYSAVSRAGTIHLLSVSGLHLSVLTAMLLRLLERLRLSRRWRSLLAILAALAFSALVGLSASIVRAFTMTTISLLAGMLSDTRRDSLSALGLSVTVICIAWPEWVLGRGFWLSAGSTLGILLFADTLTAKMNARLEGQGKLRGRFVQFATGAVAVSLAAYTVTLPLLIFFFGWISLVSPLANLLVTPFVPGIILGGILCALVGGTALPLRLIALLVDFCTAAVIRISQIMAGLPFATISLDELWILLWLGLAVAAAAALIRFRGGRGLAGYAALLLALTFGTGSLSHSVADRDIVQLATIADCDAAVLLRGDEAVVLGTPAYYEAGRLLRYLEFRGVRTIRAVIAHDCGEQVGSGLLRLAERYPVDCVIGPNDSYILGQIAAALPDIPVYSGGYAHVELLGGVQITTTVPDGDVAARVGRSTIVKTAAEYDIMSVDRACTIGLFPDGKTVLQGAPAREPTPIGAMLHGESRYLHFF